MRLHRPYIPLEVRVKVAERQVAATVGEVTAAACGILGRSNKQRLSKLLMLLFGETVPELHHRPALLNRQSYISKGKIVYDPPANDPEHLVYLDPQDHDIETRVRGVGAQFSDLAQARRRKAKLRKANRPKHKWPSRPMRSTTAKARGGKDRTKPMGVHNGTDRD